MDAGALDRVHCVQIKEGATGHSYQSLFKDVLDGNVTEVTVLDPYIRAKHQVGTQLLYNTWHVLLVTVRPNNY